MPDVHDKATRSRNMAAITGKDTKPELTVRKTLYAAGFRYRLHRKDLPGKPDLVLTKYKAAIFVHGCFWHQHDCALFKWPKTRAEFWREKIGRNVERDKAALAKLHDIGWRTAIVWECALKGRYRRELTEVSDMLGNWLRGHQKVLTISGIEQ